jgi:agmatinase
MEVIPSLPFGGERGDPVSAFCVLLPVPYERTTTYRQGTAKGPAALLEASAQVELFDEETRIEPLERGVATLESVSSGAMPDHLAERLEPMAGKWLDEGKLVGCLGGEHSISLGPIRAAAKRHPGLGILQIDAHPDLRDSYEGTKYGHGCVMRRALDDESIASLVQVGLRAISDEDDEAMKADARIHPHFAFELARRPVDEWVADVVAALPDKVYLSFDLDGLDPSIIPGTGTPEPGGLGWWDALALLRAVFTQREVVAFDVVELLPEPPSHVSDFAAARLVFKILAYAAASL